MLCSGCSTNIGEHILLYNKLWSIILERSDKKVKHNSPENLNEQDGLEAGKLLDMLHLKEMCCRMEMIGRVRASELNVSMRK
jgi:DNA-directed RNA polymerase subunit N (RpoN/RPB10)